MEATIVSDSVKHYPVLLKEIISVISPQHGGTFIDCTFGQGGYTKKILDFKNTNVIALDRDISVKAKAQKFQEKYKKRFKFKNIKFSNYSFKYIFDKISKGGVLVAPAASALADIDKNKHYYKSLIKSDIVIFDSGFFCILLRIFRGIKVKKLSGYKFLKLFLDCWIDYSFPVDRSPVLNYLEQ